MQTTENRNVREDALGFFRKNLKSPDYTPKGSAFDMQRMFKYSDLENEFWAMVISNKSSRELYLSLFETENEFSKIIVPLDEESYFDYNDKYSELKKFLFAETAIAIKTLDKKRSLFHFIGKSVIELSIKKKYKEIVTLRDDLLKSNCRFILSISNRAASFRRIPESERADVFQNACLGFIHAIGLFDKKHSVPLASYAVYWMNHYISRDFVNNGQTIRLPVYMKEVLSRMKMFIARFEMKHSRYPTEMEIRRGARVSEKKYADLKHIGPIVSLDAPVKFREESLDAYDIIPAPEKDEPFKELECNIDVIIQGAGLTNIEVAVIKGRFGLNKEGIEENLDVIGKRFTLSKERIRQLESAGLKKLEAQVKKIGLI